MKTRDEILNNFMRILAAGEERPANMTPEQYEELTRGIYSASGESDYNESEDDLELRDLFGPSESPIPLTNVKLSPRDMDEEPVSLTDVKSPAPAPDRMPENELVGLIKSDPGHLVTNLMIQRDPKYADFNTMYLLLESLYSWIKETGVDVSEGTVLYDESRYIIDFLNQAIDEKMKKAEEQ